MKNMNKNLMNKVTFLLFLLGFLSCTMPEKTMALNQDMEVYYSIDVEINPSMSYLTGNTTVEILYSNEKSYEFHLLKSLKITNFQSSMFDMKIEDENEFYSKIIITRKFPSKNSVFHISYEGKVFNPPAETNLTQRHSHSEGIISSKPDEGIYLPSGSFYPSISDVIGNFTVKVKGPADYTFVTSGNMKKISSDSKFNVREWKMPFPTDGITIVGGKFIEYSKTFDGTEFQLFTYDSTKFAETYLNSNIKYYQIYTNLFGKYPFNTFSIVENFFATGFGMPGYTLLSGKLLVMPWVTLSPGSLAHEFVHNWWGNSVYVDYSGGNWCEALTTFSSNYYYNVEENKAAEMLDWRKKALMAIDALEPEKNYPVIDFKYQEDMFDAVIGYSKGAFIFYEIYKFAGKEAFFIALKNFANEFKGKRAYWSDLIDYFVKFAPTEITAKYNLKEIINQWLSSKDIPAVRLLDAKKNGNTIDITLEKTTDLTLTIPIKLIGKEKSEYFNFVVSDKKFSTKINADFDVEKIQVDPDYMALRKIYDWEKPFSFGRTLSSNPLVVLPSENSPNYKVAKEFYDELVASDYKFSFKSSDKLTNDDIKNNSLFLLGNSHEYDLMKNILKNLPDGLEISNGNYEVDGKSSPESENCMLFCTDHPADATKYCTAIVFDNLTDIKSLRRFFHYQSYSMALLSITKPGRPIFSTEVYPNVTSKVEMEKAF
ncbi:MAG: hypothetical protein A2X64_04890 [Ignavibacteria bacterium GWF2_33_9]|nr:MAG: hypothetical protein A2X64_04890 [Ignavibacteria bacterium GWF2_33_9]